MKKTMMVAALAGVLVFLLTPSIFAQWGPDIRLTYDPAISSSQWCNGWRIATDGDRVHVVWIDNRDAGGISTNFDVWYKRSTDGGASWSQDVRLSVFDNYVSSHPTIAVAGDIVHVVYDNNAITGYGFTILYKRSTDNGCTWSAPITLGSSNSVELRPSMAVSGPNVHVIWEDMYSYQNDLHYIHSTDNGENWIDNHTFQSDHFMCNASIGVSGQYVHVAWDDDRYYHDPNHNHYLFDVYYRRSKDGGATWVESDFALSDHHQSDAGNAPTLTTSGSNVHVFWQNLTTSKIHYRRSTDNGVNGSWLPEVPLSTGNGISQLPNAVALGNDVHLVWKDTRDGPLYIYYKHSQDDGANWGDDYRITATSGSDWPSISTSGNISHLIWTAGDIYSSEIYYKRNPPGNGFFGFKTDSSNARHLIRDPTRGHLHMVVTGKNYQGIDQIYYSRSTDNGLSWPFLTPLGTGGKHPSIGLAILPGDVYPPQIAVCVTYENTSSSGALYYWYNNGYNDPGMGTWLACPFYDTDYGRTPSLVTVESDPPRVFVAFHQSSTATVKCFNFNFNDCSNSTKEVIDGSGGPLQPSLAVDGNGEIYAAWKRGDQIRYARRNGGAWDDISRVDQTDSPSYQPFIDCYGDSIFVVWTDEFYPPSDVIRASKTPPDIQWQYSNPSNSADLSSESPSQSGRDFTNWSEGNGAASMPDINYWIPGYGQGVVESNPDWWSYWPHSQTAFTMMGDIYLSAWTECPNPNDPEPQRAYSVLTKQTFIPIFGDGGAFYSASAGGTEPSPYLKKRDGVMRFGNKAVDYARDSLVYELPYLNPIFDYYLKVSSYRETGNDWTQALSLDGVTARNVRFTPNRVDTAWIKIPPELYRQDRKVVFSLKKVRGDYVTSLGLTLYQRDPRRGKGGGQSGEAVSQHVREVFAVYPNPVSDQAQIEFSLKASGQVSLSVYDIMGRLVKAVVNDIKPAGVYRATWDGKFQDGGRAPIGVYLLRLNAPGIAKTTKVTLLR